MSKKRKPPLPASSDKVSEAQPLIELPISYFKGIGRVVQAHALLEHNVSRLVFDLMKIKRPEGRVAFEYRAASTMFTLARRLLELRGITPTIDVVALEDQIKELCTARDQLAHGIWLERKSRICLLLTVGNYDTPEGKRSRPILPQALPLPDKYFDDTRKTILETAAIVNGLREAIAPALQASPQKSA